MRNTRILISGASVAGPALAYWLRRSGFVPTVVERAPALREGGYAVDFRGATHFELLARMGILDDVRRAQTHMGAVSYVDAEGRTLATMPADLMSGDVEILRGDLCRILHERTRHDTEYLFGDSITALREDACGVHVGFENSPPRTFDLVVGADGLHSGVRALAFGDESRFVRDLGYHVGVFTTANHLGLDHTGRIHAMPGKLAGMYIARGNTEAKAFFYFASPPVACDHRDRAAQQRILADTYADAGWEVPRLLGDMAQAPDFYFDSISQVRMRRWSSGRVVLLGDAAYCASPLSGMGTGLALVGGYVLAGELAAADGDHRVAFGRYEERMRDYVAACQKLAHGAGPSFVPATRTGIWLRNRLFRVLPYLPGKKSLAERPRRVAESLALPEYRTGAAQPLSS